ERSDDLTRWFYRRSWTPAAAPEVKVVPGTAFLVLADAGSPGDELGDRLAREGYPVVRVRSGERFQGGGDHYAVRPGSAGDWEELARALRDTGTLPDVAVHAWCLEGATEEDRDLDDLEGIEDAAFFAPLYLLQALERVVPGHPLRLVAAATRTLPVEEDESVRPLHSLLLGPIRVAPRELPGVNARIVDVGASLTEEDRREATLEFLAGEVASPSDATGVALRGSDRFVESFERSPAPPPAERHGLREGATFLVTGGLGGIGLVAARFLASEAKARLVLVGRSGLPAPEERAAWLEQHPGDEKTARAIREVEALEAMGSEVLVLKGDVTDVDRMMEVVEAAVERFGSLDGVIHAAGVLDDGPLLARDEEQLRAVLAPKVRGTLVLERAVRQADPEVFVLFSSISAVLGAPGQIDYTAANAFLDAFAFARSGDTAGRTVAIGWGPWKEVGMAAEVAGLERYATAPGSGPRHAVPLEHPLFDRRIESDGEVVFLTRFELGRHWMLDEHRMRDGGWVLPGSGYVELIHAAVLEVEGEGFSRLADLLFLRPFGISEGESRELEVRLASRGDGVGHDVVVRSRRPDLDEWIEHAVATTFRDAPSRDGAPAKLDELLGRIGVPRDGGPGPHPFMDFGPRWSNVRGTCATGDEALLRLELPEGFLDDLEGVRLHPALLDMATAGAQGLIGDVGRGEGAFVPVGYGSIRPLGSVGAELTSHVTLKEVDEEGAFVSFDVTIYDFAGEPVVEIRDFSMMRITESQLGDGEDEAEGPSWLRNAIAPVDGAEVLRIVLEGRTSPHLLVSPRPIEILKEETARAAREVPPARRGGRASRVDITPVEEALASHEAVAEVAALAAEEVDGGVRVVAFVSFEPGRHATVSELRSFVRDRVPPEVVPKNFVEEAVLPRDTNGRIDRSALRDPFAEVDDYVAPRTPTEKAIARIWEELLGLERVSVHENFLDVGGHSLVGIRTLARIEKATGVRPHANALTLQTLAQLAGDVDKERREGTEAVDPGSSGADDGFLARVRKVIVGR
ncbi:MAG: SDR family NAD(P)-dependent oxidoreductase, partial [Longimicrobiales bacterium]|nr:SDR family NAD(P)-dependent oxidoreductase [Longimicrobiales bacterium]